MPDLVLKGKAIKLGDNISTDDIIPGRFAHLRSNLPELAKHVLEDAAPEFASRRLCQREVKARQFWWRARTSVWVPVGNMHRW